MSKRIIIMGATSGLGRACAEDFISRGYIVGVCGRRTEELEQIRTIAPERVYVATIDITNLDADKQLLELIERMVVWIPISTCRVSVRIISRSILRLS